MEDGTKRINIAVVGKYVNLHDSYVSVNEALMHASAHLGARANVEVARVRGA